MPTTLPILSAKARFVPRLTLGQTIQFFVLLGRSGWLHHRLNAAHRRVRRLKTETADHALLQVAERWLACHEEIATLLGRPAPPHVEEMRTVLGELRS